MVEIKEGKIGAGIDEAVAKGRGIQSDGVIINKQIPSQTQALVVVNVESEISQKSPGAIVGPSDLAKRIVID